MVRLEPVVRGDDPADQFMPDDVVIRQVAKRDVFNVVQDALHDSKSTTGAARQVDLGDVTGDDDLGAEAETG